MSVIRRRRSNPFGPENGASSELRLVSAVIEDAINCYHQYLFATGNPGRRLFCEAETWIMSRDGRTLFSFEHLCDLAGLDAAYLRRRLLHWRDRQLAQAEAAADLCESIFTDDDQQIDVRVAHRTLTTSTSKQM